MKVLARLTLEKKIFKQENKCTYDTNNQFYVISGSTVSKNWKNPVLDEGKGSTSRSKKGEGQKK